MKYPIDSGSGLPLVGGPLCGLIYDVPDNVVIIEESIESTGRIAEYRRMTGKDGDVFDFSRTHPDADLIESGIWWSDKQRSFIVEINCLDKRTGEWKIRSKTFKELQAARDHCKEIWSS
jgi:hypothetical protein